MSVLDEFDKKEWDGEFGTVEMRFEEEHSLIFITGPCDDPIIVTPKEAIDFVESLRSFAMNKLTSKEKKKLRDG